ncbi:hypothetical protein HNR48_002460 [Pseudoteredinibacter isoporae]|uniref:Uncharacterized protein n=1 Tax=Pseudoteredinibacter isoporae TaxID=570281 RepID=A0A7X0JVF6_9GAMM|nr:hypothetical protein [Pseudoteredinibacter isoporae]
MPIALVCHGLRVVLSVCKVSKKETGHLPGFFFAYFWVFLPYFSFLPFGLFLRRLDFLFLGNSQ